MWTFEHTLEAEVAPEAIWRLWSDVSSWERWDADIDRATLEGPFATGSRGKLKPRGVPAAPFTLASVVPGSSYTVEQRLPLATLRFRHELTSDGGRTRFTHRATMSGPMSGLYGVLFGRRMKANFAPIMRTLAEEAARTGPGTG